MLPRHVHDLLCCPMCKWAQLQFQGPTIQCSACARLYDYSDPVPHMLPDALRSTTFAREVGWKFWSRMQSHYKRWVRTDWSLDAARQEDALYGDFVRRADPTGKVVVDLGGFWGMNRAWMADAQSYVVVDPDDEGANDPGIPFMKELYPFYGEPFPFIHGVGEYLPVRTESVDLIIVQDALDHLLHPTMVMHEAWRVLHSGGRLAIMADVEDSPEKRGLLEDVVWVLRKKGVRGFMRGAVGKARELLGSGENRHGHMWQFTRAEIEALLSPFANVEVEEPGVLGFPHLYFFASKT